MAALEETYLIALFFFSKAYLGLKIMAQGNKRLPSQTSTDKNQKP